MKIATISESGTALASLLKQALPPLKKRSWIFEFHKEGLYRFYCTVHLPEMSGQILVLPPRKH